MPSRTAARLVFLCSLCLVLSLSAASFVRVSPELFAHLPGPLAAQHGEVLGLVQTLLLTVMATLPVVFALEAAFGSALGIHGALRPTEHAAGHCYAIDAVGHLVGGGAAGYILTFWLDAHTGLVGAAHASCRLLSARGTSGIAAAATTAAPANAAQYPNRSMPAAISGVAREIVTNCEVFCTPSARPDQRGPAYSATAVKARPLSETDRTVATTASVTATTPGAPTTAAAEVEGPRAVRRITDAAGARADGSAFGDARENWAHVAGPAADEATLADLEFAWRAVRAVKSNAILLAKDGASVGVGMGQVNRLDSAKLAVERANTLGSAVTGSQEEAPGGASGAGAGAGAAGAAGASEERARGAVAAANLIFRLNHRVALWALRTLGLPVETGIFGAHMEVSSMGDGPVTILLDSRRAF